MPEIDAEPDRLPCDMCSCSCPIHAEHPRVPARFVVSHKGQTLNVCSGRCFDSVLYHFPSATYRALIIPEPERPVPAARHRSAVALVALAWPDAEHETCLTCFGDVTRPTGNSTDPFGCHEAHASYAAAVGS